MKKTNLNYRTHRLLSVLFLSFLLLQSCQLSQLDQLAERYSGDKLYESIVSPDGDALKLIPHLQSDIEKHLETQEQKQAFLSFQKALIGQMIKNNPGFSREFYDKMHSNNKEEIKEALADASKLIEEELKELVGDNEINVKNVVDAVKEKYEVK